jgi:hypothetical protein
MVLKSGTRLGLETGTRLDSESWGQDLPLSTWVRVRGPKSRLGERQAKAKREATGLGLGGIWSWKLAGTGLPKTSPAILEHRREEMCGRSAWWVKGSESEIRNQLPHSPISVKCQMGFPKDTPSVWRTETLVSDSSALDVDLLELGMTRSDLWCVIWHMLYLVSTYNVVELVGPPLLGMSSTSIQIQISPELQALPISVIRLEPNSKYSQSRLSRIKSYSHFLSHALLIQAAQKWAVAWNWKNVYFDISCLDRAYIIGIHSANISYPRERERGSL